MDEVLDVCCKRWLALRPIRIFKDLHAQLLEVCKRATNLDDVYLAFVVVVIYFVIWGRLVWNRKDKKYLFVLVQADLLPITMRLISRVRQTRLRQAQSHLQQRHQTNSHHEAAKESSHSEAADGPPKRRRGRCPPRGSGRNRQGSLERSPWRSPGPPGKNLISVFFFVFFGDLIPQRE